MKKGILITFILINISIIISVISSTILHMNADFAYGAVKATADGLEEDENIELIKTNTVQNLLNNGLESVKRYYNFGKTLGTLSLIVLSVSSIIFVVLLIKESKAKYTTNVQPIIDKDN